MRIFAPPCLALLALFAATVHANDMPIPESLGPHTLSTHILINEPIDPTTQAHFQRWMDRFPDTTPLLVDLASPGGDSRAGRLMSEEMTRRGAVRTRVGGHQSCASICVMLWMAGSMEAETGAQLKVHGSSTEPVYPSSLKTDAEMAVFLLRKCKTESPETSRLVDETDQWQAAFARQRNPAMAALFDKTGAFGLRRAGHLTMTRRADGWEAFRAVAWRLGPDGWEAVNAPDARDGLWLLPDAGPLVHTSSKAPAEHWVDCQP
jgi:hypothetical protein